MSDIKEPVGLGAARLEEKIFEFKLNLKRMARRRYELQYEMDKIKENEEATMNAMAEVEANLKEIGA